MTQKLAQEEKSPSDTGSGRYVAKCAALLCCMVTVSTLTVVSSKRLGYAMGPYPFFILMLLSFAFVPVLLLPLLYIRWKTGGFVEDHFSNTQDRSQLFQAFLVIGLCNAFNGVCTMNANPHTPGYLQSLLAPLIVPTTVCLSIFILGSKFSRLQITGVVCVLAGQAYQVTDSSTRGSVSIFWALIFGLGQVPMSLQAVYQESVFRERKVNVIFMLFWANFFQFVLLCVLAPLAAIMPGFGSTDLEGFVGEFNRAWLCLGNRLPEEPLCGQASGWLLAVFLGMTIGMVLQSLTVKLTSASVAVIANTIVTPLSTMAFTLPVVMGPFVESLAPSAWMSLCLIVAGLLLYRYSNQIEDEYMEYFSPKDSLTDKLIATEAPEFVVSERKLPKGRKIVRPPVMLASRVGIVDSEYSNAGHAGGGCQALMFQHTTLEHVKEKTPSCFL